MSTCLSFAINCQNADSNVCQLVRSSHWYQRARERSAQLSADWSAISQLTNRIYFAMLFPRSDAARKEQCRRVDSLRDIPSDAHRQWDLLGHFHRVYRCGDGAYCSFRGLNTPPVSDRWAVEGVLRNYYAITHKPIDLDWTPGGACCARSWALSPICYKTYVRKLESARRLGDGATRRWDPGAHR